LACIIQIKKGQLDVEKALENMDFDVVKFESELKMLADHQKPKVRKKLYNQYVKYMRGCGFKLSVRGIGKTPKAEPIPEITPEIPVKPENKAETTPEAIAVEVAAQVETQKEEISVPVPQTDPVSTPTAELTPEIAPKEQPQTEPVKTKTATSNATAYFACADANLFKKLYESMCVLVGEITWKFTADSLTMRQMDPSRVAMIDLEIKKEEFEEYDVKTPGLVTFSAEEIKKVVFAKPFKKDTHMEVKIDGVTRRITFVIKDNRTRERSFPTLEADHEDIPTPKITFNAKVKVVSKQVAEDIDELNRLSDHLAIIGDADSLQMKVEGDCSKGETTYKRGDDTLLDIEVKEESRAVFSFIYLKDFIQPALCEVAMLEFATDMPLKVTLPTKFGDLKYYLAPRISCD